MNKKIYKKIFLYILYIQNYIKYIKIKIQKKILMKLNY